MSLIAIMAFMAGFGGTCLAAAILILLFDKDDL